SSPVATTPCCAHGWTRRRARATCPRSRCCCAATRWTRRSRCSAAGRRGCGPSRGETGATPYNGRESGLASGELREPATLFIDGVAHRGRYDPPAFWRHDAMSPTCPHLDQIEL